MEIEIYSNRKALQSSYVAPNVRRSHDSIL